MQRTLWAVALVAMLVPMSGCLGDDSTDPTGKTGGQNTDGTYSLPEFDDSTLSPKQYEILPAEEVWVQVGGELGVRLNNVVFRPDTTEKSPVFVNLSPYWGDTAMDGGDAFSQYMIDEYVPRGYTIVLSALRGTGHSEGCFQIGGDQELIDSRDVIDYFAAQEWSNGNVAAGGKSYDSTTQNGVIAKYPTDALKGIFHVSGITDMYRYNYREGVTYTSGLIFNGYYWLQGTDEYGASLVGAGATDDEDAESLARLAGDAACPELPEIQASGVGSGVSGLKTEYWQERDWNQFLPDSEWEGSIFFVHGFQDWNVKPDHILPWTELVPEQVDVLGWLHQDRVNGGHVYPMRDDWNVTMLRWLDSTLKGADTSMDDLWGYELQGDDGLWRHEDAFTSSRAEPTEFTAEPADLLAWTILTADEEPLRYSGAPSLKITATSTTPDPVLTAVLYRADENGTRTWINEGVFRGGLSKDLKSEDPVVPGAAKEYLIDFYPQDDVLPAGHSWVLAVGASPNYPAVLPSQDVGIVYDMTTAVFTLPLIATDNVLAPQPPATWCFAC